MASKSKNRSIFIIEDDRVQLGRYLKMARDAGLESTGTGDVLEGMAVLNKKSFAFVLTDIHLSTTGKQDTFEGIQILKHLKTHMPEVTALAMTSDPKIETYHKVMAAGAAYLFRKPILTKDELLVHLEWAQSGRRTHKMVGGKRGKPKL